MVLWSQAILITRHTDERHFHHTAHHHLVLVAASCPAWVPNDAQWIRVHPPAWLRARLQQLHPQVSKQQFREDDERCPSGSAGRQHLLHGLDVLLRFGHSTKVVPRVPEYQLAFVRDSLSRLLLPRAVFKEDALVVEPIVPLAVHSLHPR